MVPVPRIRIRKGLVHAVANCTVCGFSDDNFLSAQSASKRHIRETGHTVTLDLGYAVTYERGEE